MQLCRRAAVCLVCFFIFWRTVFCAPTQPTLSAVLDASNNFTIDLPEACKESILGGLGLSSRNHSAEVGVDKMTWKISDTLSLALTICNWEPDPKTILAVLAAAHTAVGKKPAAGLLDKKFTQKSDNKYNTLLFEITPGYVDKRLMWGDVGEVLGENGLPTFYEKTRQWHTVYFDVLHGARGKLGYGSVRRWWQLEPANGGGNRAIGDGVVLVES